MNEKKTTNFPFAMRLQLVRYCIAQRPFVMFSTRALLIFFTFISFCRRLVKLNLIIPYRRLECLMPTFNSEHELYLQLLGCGEMSDRTLWDELL